MFKIVDHLRLVNLKLKHFGFDKLIDHSNK